MFNSSSTLTIANASKLQLTSFCSSKFNGTWKENTEVEIVDASADGFKEFLQFIYLGEVSITVDNVAEVMFLGKKYHIDECLAACSKFLKNILDEKNICWGYQLAITYEQENLKRFCEVVIGSKTKEVLASDGFLRCDFNVLSHIVMLNRLACSEYDLFEACMKRIETLGQENESAKEAAKTECRNLFNHFRFGSLSNDELVALSSDYSQWFSYQEYREIIQLTLSANFQPKLLNENRQKRIDSIPHMNQNQISYYRVLSRFGSAQKYNIKNIETTTFSTNQSVLLTKIFCNYIYKNQQRLTEKLSTELTIFELPDQAHPDKKNTLHTEKTHFLCNKETAITLHQPLFIKNWLKYEIQFKQTPSNESCNWSLLKTEISDGDFTVKFHDDIPDNDTLSRGLIYKICFIRI